MSLSSCFFVKFGELGGFTAIQTKLNTEEIEIAVRLTLLIFVFVLSLHMASHILKVMKYFLPLVMD